MKTLQKLAQIIAAGLLLTACAPEEIVTVVEDPCVLAVTPITGHSDMLGTWSWCRTITISKTTGTDTLTPNDVGIEMSVEFTSNKEAIVFQGTTKTGTYPFSLREMLTSDEILFEVLNPVSHPSLNIEMDGGTDGRG